MARNGCGDTTVEPPGRGMLRSDSRSTRDSFDTVSPTITGYSLCILARREVGAIPLMNMACVPMP